MPSSQHFHRLSSSLSLLLLSPPDLQLITLEGASLPCHRLLLSLHSSTLRPLLLTLPPPTALLLPLHTAPLASLLSLLASGASASFSGYRPAQVLEAAELLGVIIEDLQILPFEDFQCPDESQMEDVKDINLKSELSPKGYSMVVDNNQEHTELAKYEKEQLQLLQNSKENIEVFNKLEDLSCTTCGHVSSTRHNFWRHKQKHHSLNFKCDQCDFKTKDKSHMKRHFAFKHAGLRYNCDVCDYQSAYSKDVRRHGNIKHSDRTKTHNCTICKYKTHTAIYLKRHTKKKHQVAEMRKAVSTLEV